MKRPLLVALAATLGAAPVSGQVDPVEKLAEVLPPTIVASVMERVEAARGLGLPSSAVANVALQGAAKGRGADEILAAVDGLIGDMGRASDALQAGGRRPGEGEVEAAATAMSMGVDAESISALARSTPSGQTLSVPIAVLGGLAERGLPSDQALAAVTARLEGRVGNPSPDVPGIGMGGQPATPGLGPATGMSGFPVPVGGPNTPVGPPSRGGGRPSNLPTPPGQGTTAGGGPSGS